MELHSNGIVKVIRNDTSFNTFFIVLDPHQGHSTISAHTNIRTGTRTTISPCQSTPTLSRPAVLAGKWAGIAGRLMAARSPKSAWACISALFLIATMSRSRASVGPHPRTNPLHYRQRMRASAPPTNPPSCLFVAEPPSRSPLLESDFSFSTADSMTMQNQVRRSH